MPRPCPARACACLATKGGRPDISHTQIHRQHGHAHMPQHRPLTQGMMPRHDYTHGRTTHSHGCIRVQAVTPTSRGNRGSKRVANCVVCARPRTSSRCASIAEPGWIVNIVGLKGKPRAGASLDRSSHAWYCFSCTVHIPRHSNTAPERFLRLRHDSNAQRMSVHIAAMRHWTGS